MPSHRPVTGKKLVVDTELRMDKPKTRLELKNDVGGFLG
jgi:hypothetical protein